MRSGSQAKSERRMLVICPFPQGVAAGQRLKYEQYFDDWRSEGWHIDVSPYMDRLMWSVVYERGHAVTKITGVVRGHLKRLRDLFRISSYDVVYIFMWVTPFGSTVMERLTRRLARRVVFDVEDNVLIEQTLPKDLNPNPIARILKGPGKARFLIKSADHVISSSPFLNDFCLAINDRRQCTYVSSSVDTGRFLPATSYRNDKPVVVGWTGTFSSKVFLDQLRDVFRRLGERVAFKLKVIGNFDYELPGVDLEVVRWTKEREVADLQTLDIGVYPLPHNEWVLGKSGLKAIQYMAFGLPCVATNVGTTPMLIEHRKTGLLVQTDEEWLEALEELIRRPELRRELGEAARKTVVANYSLQAISGKYRAVIESVMAEE